MYKKIIFITLLANFLNCFVSYADEGMWLPLLIKRLNYTNMQKLGLKLSADEIYSVNNSSLKDAVVNFGGFCTGEIISKDGLILTNHHCGYEPIQSHSSVEKDYLTNGFWAKKREEELPNPGLTVAFLVRMEDVTQQVLSKIPGNATAEQREQIIEAARKELQDKAVEGSHYNAEVKSFFEGNEFYLFVYETFKDVRLVGAPPSSIGKFGGDTDNWMWPRHTGDFSLFRVYAGPDGKPAEYSTNNVPLKPKHYLPISLKGVTENDFTMVLGFPGSTERYLTSEGVKLAFEQSNPLRIKIRGKRLGIMKEAMDASPEIKIKYAATYAQISNYYKYFIGQNQGLDRLDIIDRKKLEEKQFLQWVNATPERKKEYGNLLTAFEKTYSDYRKINPVYIYLEEGAFGSEILLLAYKFNTLAQALATENKELINAAKEEVKKTTQEFYKNYSKETDKKIFAALLQMYYNDLNKAAHPSIFKTVDKKFKGNFEKYAEHVFSKSFLTSQAKIDGFLNNPSLKVLEKDPAYQTMSSIIGDFRSMFGPYLGKIYGDLDSLNSVYLKAVKEMKKDERIYPDANSTMRISYGTVQDYYPRDAVHYLYYTTLEGIMEKKDSTNEEFIVPKKLVSLYKDKDYGKYANDKGELPVCFITNNDITGGNSGSPVINGEGHLVGTAFDGNWEAMSGDIVYEPNLQRCIVTDIRYVLFIIDKFAGANNIINELTLVTESPSDTTGDIKSEKKKEKEKALEPVAD